MEIIKKNFFVWILIFVFIFLCFILLKNNLLRDSVSEWTSSARVEQIHSVKIAGKIIKVDLALTSEAQERGLSGRKKLEEDEGMLFVFSHMGQYPFWMKDMNFPLDIIWIAPSENGNLNDLHVVYIKKNATPESYPNTFTPNQNAKYVLEVLSQFSEKNNLKEGDKVEFLSS